MMYSESPSLLLCGSVLLNTDTAYLNRIRSSLIHDPYLSDLRQSVTELPALWSLLTIEEPALERVDAAPLLQDVATWIQNGDISTLPTASESSRNTRMAVLTVLAHIVEYMSYLHSQEVAGEEDAHRIVLEGLQHGGIQGLCIGLLSAIALACSQTKVEVAKYGAVAVRLALCVGAFVDLSEVETEEPTVCLSTRWPVSEGDGKDESLTAMLKNYPQVRCSLCCLPPYAAKCD